MNMKSPDRVREENAQRALGRQLQGSRQKMPIGRIRVTINRRTDMACALTVLGYEQ